LDALYIPEISFVVPTKDRESILLESLQHLWNAVGNDHVEVIVVNDSKVALHLAAGLNDKRLRIVANTGKGVASARNTGASIAGASLLWFLDDDMWINREMYLRALELHKSFPQGVFNFNWVYPPVLDQQIQTMPFGRFLRSIEFTTMKGWCKGMVWEENTLLNSDWIAGATLLIPAKIYHDVNGYDSTFPLAGFEDHDFSVRIKSEGFKVYIDTTVKAYHNEVNKTSLRGFLKRTYNNAVTRRHGVKIGYTSQQLTFDSVRKIGYSIVSALQPLLLFLLDQWKFGAWADPLYFRLCNLLIGTAIYKGYTSNE
jgi:GT2 family glycosyltransferase